MTRHSNVVFNARALKLSSRINAGQRSCSELEDPKAVKSNPKFSPIHLEEEAVLQTLEHNRNVVRGANGEALRYASTSLRSDREFVLKAVAINGLALKYVTPELQNDPEVVFAALNQNGMAVEFASQGLQHDEEVACAAVKQTLDAVPLLVPEMMERLRVRMCTDPSGQWKHDKAFMMEAVRQDGLLLQHASLRLIRDNDLVLAAVQENGMALQYAKHHQNDKKMVTEAVAENGQAIQFASSKLRNDREIVWKALRQDGMVLEHLSEEKRADLFIVIQAIGQNGLALQFASDELRADPGVVVRAVLYNLGAWQYAAQELKDDPTVLPQTLQDAIRSGADAVQQRNSQVQRLLQDLKITPSGKLSHAISISGKKPAAMAQGVWKWARSSGRVSAGSVVDFNESEDMFELAATPTSKKRIGALKSSETKSGRSRLANQQREAEVDKRRWLQQRKESTGSVPTTRGSSQSTGSVPTTRGSSQRSLTSPPQVERPRPAPLQTLTSSQPPFPTQTPSSAQTGVTTLLPTSTQTGVTALPSPPTPAQSRPKSAETGVVSAPWWRPLLPGRPGSAVGKRLRRGA